MQNDHYLQVMQPLKALISQDNLADIPEIRLNPNSGLGLISSNIASLALSSDTTDGDAVPQTELIFDQIAEYLGNTENIARVEILELLPKALAAVVENSYNTLNTVVTPAVDDIRKNIDERYAVLLTRENADLLIPDGMASTIAESGYTFINWEGIDSPVRQQQIIDNACSNANLTQVQLSTLNVGYIKNKLKVAGLVNVNIPDELNEQLLQKIKAVFGQSGEFSESTINRIWLIIRSTEAYDRFISECQFQLNDIRNVATVVLNLVQFTNAFSKISQMIPSLIGDDLTPDTVEAIRANIEKVTQTIIALQYWLLFIKETKFKESLIITNTIINGPVYREFVADGKSIVDIYNYLKAFHFNRPIPLEGIKLSTVKSTDVADYLEKASAKVQQHAGFIKSKCLIGAYMHAIRLFVMDTNNQTIFPQLADKVFVSQFTAAASAKAVGLAGNIANTDNVLYELIISSFYSGSIIATMYKYLGIGFEDLTENSDLDITDDTILNAQAKAIAEMLVDYLVNIVTVPVAQIEQSLECVY